MCPHPVIKKGYQILNTRDKDNQPVKHDSSYCVSCGKEIK